MGQCCTCCTHVDGKQAFRDQYTGFRYSLVSVWKDGHSPRWRRRFIIDTCHDLIAMLTDDPQAFSKTGYTIEEVLYIWAHASLDHPQEGRNQMDADVQRLIDILNKTPNHVPVHIVIMLKIQMAAHQAQWATVRKLCTPADEKFALVSSNTVSAHADPTEREYILECYGMYVNHCAHAVVNDPAASYATRREEMKMVLAEVLSLHWRCHIEAARCATLLTESLFRYACEAGDEKTASDMFARMSPQTDQAYEKLIDCWVAAAPLAVHVILHWLHKRYQAFPITANALRLAEFLDEKSICADAVVVCTDILGKHRANASLDEQIGATRIRARCYRRMDQHALATIDEQALIHLERAKGPEYDIVTQPVHVVPNRVDAGDA